MSSSALDYSRTEGNGLIAYSRGDELIFVHSVDDYSKFLTLAISDKDRRGSLVLSLWNKRQQKLLQSNDSMHTRALEETYETLNRAMNDYDNVRAEHLAMVRAGIDLKKKYSEWRQRLAICDLECTMHGEQITSPKYFVDGKFAGLVDLLFEALNSRDAAQFAISLNKQELYKVDFEKIWRDFSHWLITDEANGLMQFARNKLELALMTDVAKLLDTNCASIDCWHNAYERAADARYETRAMKETHSETAADFAADALAYIASAATADDRQSMGKASGSLIYAAKALAAASPGMKTEAAQTLAHYTQKNKLLMFLESEYQRNEKSH
jgi:hypothetical protein